MKNRVNIRLGNERIISYIFSISINKNNKITIAIRREEGSRTPYITKN
jgi:hypothetical protein